MVSQERAATVVSEEYRYIGRPLKRKEDLRFLTGKATYATDIKLPQMLTAVFVRSPYAHASIKSIDVTEAISSEGVFAVYTGKDLAHLIGQVPCAIHLPFAKYPKHPPIATDEVKFAGEIVACVLAEDEYKAMDAAELVKVDYEPMPVAIEPEKALENRDVLVHKELPDNVAYTLKERFGDLDGAFQGSSHNFSFQIRYQRVFSLAIEPRAVLASHDESTSELTVWTSTQYPHIARTFISSSLNHPENKLRVIAPDLGGGFGGKSNIYAEELLVPCMAKLTKRPVRWLESRSESFVATAHARDVIQFVDVAVDRNGKILGLKLRMISDLGAYYHLLSPLFPLLIALLIPTCYKIRAYEFEVNAVFTNKKGIDAYRGVASGEANYLMERVLELVAKRLSLDPVEVRLKNFIQSEDYPYSTISGSVHERGDLPRSLRRATEVLDYKGFRAIQRNAWKEGRYLGVGFSSYWELSGVGPAPALERLGLQHGGFESAAVRVLPSGKVVVVTGSSSHGQGHETAFAQVAADVLQLDPNEITVTHGDTANAPYGIGTWSSRSAQLGGSAIKIACERVRQKATLIASLLLEAKPEEVRFERGAFHSTTKSVTFNQVVTQAYLGTRLPPTVEPGLEAFCYYNPPDFAYSSGTHAAIVQVDPETGKVRVMKYIAVNDFGRVINPMIVEGQVHGGVMQGIGQALLEEVVYNGEGSLLTNNLLNYLIPTAADPVGGNPANFELDYYSTETSANPLGVKGMGESGTIAAPAAIVNAVEDALSPLGVEMTDMPLKPERVLKLIRKAKS